MRRYEMICQLLNTLGADYDWRDIRITFSRNLPQNPVDNAEYAQKMSGVISKKTLLEGLPMVSDVDDELARIESEARGDE